jgi:hypothetical protein
VAGQSGGSNTESASRRWTAKTITYYLYIAFVEDSIAKTTFGSRQWLCLFLYHEWQQAQVFGAIDSFSAYEDELDEEFALAGRLPDVNARCKEFLNEKYAVATALAMGEGVACWGCLDGIWGAEIKSTYTITGIVPDEMPVVKKVMEISDHVKIT